MADVVEVDTSRVEAPVTWKTYMMCAFAAFGGIFFGYDSGYISGVMAMDFFITEFEGLVSNSPAQQIHFQGRCR
jgi:hypothetical protein